MARHIGIDLGTSFTRIFMPGRGIILREPTAAAVDTENSELLTASQSGIRRFLLPFRGASRR